MLFSPIPSWVFEDLCQLYNHHQNMYHITHERKGCDKRVNVGILLGIRVI